MGQRLTGTERERFRGVFALLLTPFHANGEIDWTAYDAHIDWQLAASPQGLFAVCGTSEMHTLTVEERISLAERAVKRAGGIPVTATANVGEDPQLHPEELKRMEQTGVAGIVLVPPPADIGVDPQRKFDYYAKLADACSLPVFLYEWPHRGHHLLDAGTYGELVRQAGVSGIKDTTCTVDGIRAKLEAAPDSLVYQANMAFMLEALALGGAGMECIHSAAAARMVVDLWQAAQAGDDGRARHLHTRLVFLNGVLSGGHPATAKYLARLQGQPMSMTCRAIDAPLKQDRLKAIEVFHQFCRTELAGAEGE